MDGIVTYHPPSNANITLKVTVSHVFTVVNQKKGNKMGTRNPPAVLKRDILIQLSDETELTVGLLQSALANIPPEMPLWIHEPEYHDDPNSPGSKVTVQWYPEHAYREGAQPIEEHVSLTIWHPC